MALLEYGASTATVKQGFAPDQISWLSTDFFFQDEKPLLLRASTIVSTDLEGDRPSVLVPWIDTDDDIPFVAEGEEIDISDLGTSQTEVRTGKLAKMVVMSRELARQDSVPDQYLKTANHSMITAANTFFLNHKEDPAQPNFSVGLLEDPKVIPISLPKITTNFDPLAQAIATSQLAGGRPDLLVINPATWAALQTIKTADSSSTPILGLGTDEVERRLMGLEVRTDQAMPINKILVIDPSSIVGVCGPIEAASDASRYFERDSVAVRTVWRIGWKVMHTQRNVTVDVAIPATEDDLPGNEEG